jgi:hypothetical protein
MYLSGPGQIHWRANVREFAVIEIHKSVAASGVLMLNPLDQLPDGIHRVRPRKFANSPKMSGVESRKRIADGHIPSAEGRSPLPH